MIVEVIVPDVGAAGGNVRLVEWLAREGDPIAAGAPLFVLETDKATQAIEAFRAGYLRRILVTAGSEVGLGAAVALLADTLDEPVDLAAKTSAATSRPPAEIGASAHRSATSSRPGRILTSPVARRLAHEHGLELKSINGSGPEGQIHKRDVLRALETASSAATVIPLSAIRREIARRTRQSKAEIPHFYAGITVDMSEAVRLRTELVKDAGKKGCVPPTLNDFIVLAAARALGRIPELNSCWQEDRVVRYPSINIGIAIAVEGGVLTPVIRKADRCGIFELAEITADLRDRSVAGKLTAEELTGGAMTVSNLGMFGLDWFVAIINPPQAAAIAVGAIRPQPAVVEGRLAVREMMEATLSVDHRIADGASAARFLNEFRRLLEAPWSLVPSAVETRVHQ